MKRLLTLIIFAIFCTAAIAQKGGTVRGKVFDKETGEPIAFGTVLLEGTTIGTNTDLDGFFSMSNVEAGTYSMVVSYVGYADGKVPINVVDGGIVFENVFLAAGGVDLDVVEVSASKGRARTEVQISKVTVTPKQIQSMPSASGEADIAQYLTVLPGVVNTGDQGGQLYIRGGSPIQNKVLLDGMTIYNPFHSIGFFSVFETETIRNVEVLTGGFNAEYGGRMSAIVDITTREGNKKRFGGVASANPFMAKILLEGPLKKLEEGGGSISYMVTGKKSFIDQTSKSLYSYAENAIDTTGGLPYNFQDLYGKVSFASQNGSKLDLFGFNFQDGVDYSSAASIGWNASGGGANFKLIPPNSNLILGGRFTFSNYDIELIEQGEDPRTSGIVDYSGQLDFTYFGRNSEVKYGLNFNGISTDFKFKNFLGNTIEQRDNTTEVSAFIKFRQTIGNLVVEPSLRFTNYVTQKSQIVIEPRLGAKLNLSDNFRLKFAGGLYSQNLISARNEQDIVNLFVGFLSGPEERIYLPGTETETKDRLQHAVHAIGGFEIDFGKNITVNVEPYYKGFTQLIGLNRNKQEATDPNFQTETGKARGLDISTTYLGKRFYSFLGYSIGKVTRNDGEQEYPTHFDRRHNINFLATYALGEKKDWEIGLRYNYGTGFPFTLTQGFYSNYNFSEGLSTDYLTENGELGIIYDENRNAGRLPDYARMDISVKKTIEFSKYSSLEITAAVTNALNRENIFYFDRVEYERVNQLPTLPSLSVTLRF